MTSTDRICLFNGLNISMTDRPGIKICTDSAIKNTVLYDAQTATWFALVVLSHKLDFLFSSPHALLTERKTLRTCLLLLRILFFIILPVLVLCLMLTQNILFFMALLVCFTLMLTLDKYKRKIAANLAVFLVQSDIDIVGIPNLTLYQLTERIGKKYALPTLVDMIAGWDWMLRKVLIVSYMAVLLIFFLNYIWGAVIYIGALLWAVWFFRLAPLNIFSGYLTTNSICPAHNITKARQ